MQINNITPESTVSTDQLLALHGVNVKGRIGGCLTRLIVDGEEFSFEPCRPGYVNLVNVKMNKVIVVVPVDIKIHDAIKLCVKALTEAGVLK